MSNALPGSDIIIGINDDYEAFLIGFRQIFFEINTGNLLLHQWNITQHPELVETYEKFDNHDVFLPFKLYFDVDNDSLAKTESNYGKIPPVVTYSTRYIEKNGKQDLILISIGKVYQSTRFSYLQHFIVRQFFSVSQKNVQYLMLLIFVF